MCSNGRWFSVARVSRAPSPIPHQDNAQRRTTPAVVDDYEPSTRRGCVRERLVTTGPCLPAIARGKHPLHSRTAPIGAGDARDRRNRRSETRAGSSAEETFPLYPRNLCDDSGQSPRHGAPVWSDEARQEPLRSELSTESTLATGEHQTRSASLAADTSGVRANGDNGWVAWRSNGGCA